MKIIQSLLNNILVVNNYNRKIMKQFKICYKIKLITDRRIEGRIENEKMGNNFCVCLITDKKSHIYRYNMVTHK